MAGDEEFRAFLMPSSFLRRWSYDELIPALLYFDRVTFLMDDIEESSLAPGGLRGPIELRDRPGNELVGGLLVEQHRYYWPMRELMREGVIAISSMDMGGIGRVDEDRRRLQELLDGGHDLAVEYVAAASRYHDRMRTVEDRSSDVERAVEVRYWIEDALRFLQWPGRRGWEQVTLDPDGYVALLAALRLFPGLRRLDAAGRVDAQRRVRPAPAESYVPMTVVATLLRDGLPTFATDGDPEALAEILEVRRKRSAELRAFREAMLEAAGRVTAADTELWRVPAEARRYVESLRPAFAETRRALSDGWRLPKLVLRKAGAVVAAGVAIGAAAYAESALAGSAAALAAGALGPEVVKAIKGSLDADGATEAWRETLAKGREGLGDRLAGAVAGKEAVVETSMAYLFHAQEALRRPSSDAR
jgi:hypothetical protein